MHMPHDTAAPPPRYAGCPVTLPEGGEEEEEETLMHSRRW